MNTKDNLNIRMSEDKHGNVEDTKDVIKCCNSKKDRKCNVQAKKDKRTNNDLQTTKEKTKDRDTRTSLKIGGELRYS